MWENNAEKRSGVPEVPGVLQLGWMLFMQPIRLHHMFAAWGLKGDPPLWRLLRRQQMGDRVARILARRLAMLFLLGNPTLIVVLAGLAEIIGLPVAWAGVAFGAGVGAAFGIAFGTAAGVAAGVAFGVTVGVTVGVAAGMAGGVALGGAFGVAFGVALGVAVGVAEGLAAGLARGVVIGLLFGMAGGLAVYVAFATAGVVAFGLAFVLMFFCLPFYVGEALWMSFASHMVHSKPSWTRHVALWLPFRHHDLIYLSLPGLYNYLVNVAALDPDLASSLIEEAGSTIAQKDSARRVLVELQGRSFECAARDRTWALAGALDLPFLPKLENVDDDSVLRLFRSAAQDLHAASITREHLRRRHALNRAAATLKSFRTSLIAKRRLDGQERRLEPTAALWLDIIDNELRALSEEERVRPQIPTPFEPGPPLRPSDAALFKGRTDLIRLIDHDLADHRRAPLLLTGPRRMGKTSLLHMLPEHLGTETIILPLNLQHLSGHPHRGHPHRWLAEALSSALPERPDPPESTAWTETLTWLQQLENSLGKSRILIAVDEIERVQTGIEEGWTTPAFLDFLRAAGDSLRNIRLLLVSAHPLHRLGRAWTDRLISIIHRDITYLLPGEAEDLIRNPMPGFPDIYPPGGVDRIVCETHGHPYLVQLVCDALVRDLNGQERLTATDADLTRALDRALDATPLFRELWSDRNDGERALLRRLAAEGEVAVDAEDPALRELVQQGHVERVEGRCRVAVPLFGAWIRERA
jgi:hypothetical protein